MALLRNLRWYTDCEASKMRRARRRRRRRRQKKKKFIVQLSSQVIFVLLWLATDLHLLLRLRIRGGCTSNSHTSTRRDVN
jgi:hypothetical protein